MNPWDFRPLKDFCVEVEDRCANRNFPVFSVSKNLGILPQAERFKKRIASADTSRYKVVYSGDFAFDPMLLWSGSISRHTSSVTGVVSPAYCVFRLIKGLNPRFLHLYLTHSDRLPFYDSISFGTNERRRKAQFSDFAELEIPVPPFPEQERIVKLLDEADELRKLRTQADRRTAGLIPSLFHEMFGENAKKPHVRVKLEQIAEVVSGVAKGRKFNGRLPVEVPYLRVANVQAGHLDLSEIKTIQALPAEVEELALRKGDVLLTEGGDFDKLGRGAMLERDLPNCIHQNHVFRVRTERSKLDPIYFAQFLLTGEARMYFLGCAKRTTNLASINMTQLRALPVLLPPLALQKEFAARVSDIRAMQAEQAASRRRLDDLFQSMLHRAFQGDL